MAAIFNFLFNSMNHEILISPSKKIILYGINIQLFLQGSFRSEMKSDIYLFVTGDVRIP